MSANAYDLVFRASHNSTHNVQRPWEKSGGDADKQGTSSGAAVTWESRPSYDEMGKCRSSAGEGEEHNDIPTHCTHFSGVAQ